MGQRLAVVVMTWVAVACIPGRAAAQTGPEQTTEMVLHAFEGHSHETIDTFLAGLRPAPLDAESRARVLAGLPSRGEIHPTRKQSEKIAAAQRVLDYSARAGVI